MLLCLEGDWRETFEKRSVFGPGLQLLLLQTLAPQKDSQKFRLLPKTQDHAYRELKWIPLTDPHVTFPVSLPHLTSRGLVGLPINLVLNLAWSGLVHRRRNLILGYEKIYHFGAKLLISNKQWSPDPQMLQRSVNMSFNKEVFHDRDMLAPGSTPIPPRKTVDHRRTSAWSLL